MLQAHHRAGEYEIHLVLEVYFVERLTYVVATDAKISCSELYRSLRRIADGHVLATNKRCEVSRYATKSGPVVQNSLEFLNVSVDDLHDPVYEKNGLTRVI